MSHVTVNNKLIMLDAAIKYGELYGFHTFPIRGKVPAMAGWQALASIQQEKLVPLFEQHSHTGLAVKTGRDSNITVIDIDRHGTVDGYERWRELEEMYDEVEAPTVLTGGGGYHLYFRYCPELDGIKKLDDGIDIRSEGNLLVLPPSIHPDTGKKYEWQLDAHINDMELPTVPDWIVALARQNRGEGAQGAFTMHYKEAKPIDTWLNILEGVGKGGRNNALASLAGMLLAKNLDGRIVYEILQMWNERNNPQIPEKELYRTFLSILEKDAKKKGVKLE